ncbi:Uncharacterised protein [Klebsiella pneumoniae]|nr:Uncharacterised protein [Klebsiella pneumoniae]
MLFSHVEAVCIFRCCVFMDDGIQTCYHFRRLRILGNVSSHSHAFRTHLHTVLNKFEVTVDAGFWPS